MECNRCGAEWETIDTITYPDRCPFCGTIISGEDRDCFLIMRDIAEQYGPSILKNRRQLAAIISDVMIHHPKEMASLRMAVNEGVGDYIFHLIESDRPSNAIHRVLMQNFLRDNLGMVEERVQLVDQLFMFAFELEECKCDRNYRDKNNAYRNLADKYATQELPEVAKQLYEISMSTGNSSAVRYYRRFFLRKYPQYYSEWCIKNIVGMGYQKISQSDFRILRCRSYDENDLAHYVYEYIQSERIEDYFAQHGLLNSDVIGKLAFIVGEYYQKRGVISDTIEWYYKAIACGNEDAEYALGTYFMSFDYPPLWKKGYDILSRSENIVCSLAVAVELFNGEHIERDCQEAYRRFRDVERYAEGSEYYLGILYYYGLGCEQSIDKAIYYFEKSYELRNAPSKWHIAPFLVQLYYEKLLISGDSNCLSKLENFAEYGHIKLAQRYLIRYHSRKENLFCDRREARKYTLMFEQEDKKKIRGIKKSEAIREKENAVMLGIEAMVGMLLPDQIHNSLNHLLLCDSCLYEDDFAVSSYGMGMAFAEGNTLTKNLLRAEIYLQNCLEYISHKEDNQWFRQGLCRYGELLGQSVNNPRKLIEAVHIYQFARHCDESLHESIRENLLNTCVLLFAHYFTTNDYKTAIRYLEIAVNEGYRGDYSYIGICYMNGEGNIKRDAEKGFRWLYRFYLACVNGELDRTMEFDVVSLAYNLGLCFAGGVGTEKNIERALELWEFVKQQATEKHNHLVEALRAISERGRFIHQDTGELIMIPNVEVI